MAVAVKSTPRVNAALMPQFNGKQVTLVGKVLQQNPLIIQTSDGDQVEVATNNTTPIHNQVIEVVGTVSGHRSMTEISRTNFADGFDLDTYDKMVNLYNSQNYAAMMR
ncbi:unnamed protein product [Pedinophyceae sp. YPF-701]|nr:unnamed protein product [Pedinophyceae sp. YPF-701]